VLRLAIEEGWVDVAEAVLDSGISPNHAFSVQRPGCSDWISAPCIQLAALHGHAPIVELLLRRHASVNVTDVDGCTLLMDTARSGSAECARLLLGAGAKLDVIGPNGSAAKMAVAHSNAPVLSVLLDAGARIGDKNSLGQDCVLKAWTMVHGVNGQANMNGTKKSAAAETLEVFHTLFGRLASTGRGGTVDAYCYLCLGATSAGPWHRGLRTTIRRNSTCPVWKEQLEVLSPTQGEADFISMFLKVEVWDWDQVGDEMLIGTVIQSLEVVSSQPNATLASVFSLAANFRHNASHSPADKSPSQSSARSPDLTPSENKSCSSTRSPAQLSRQKVMRELFCGHLTMKLKLRPGAVIVDVESAQSLMQQVCIFLSDLLANSVGCRDARMQTDKTTCPTGPGDKGDR
jgi:ankyrin repeat protein